MDTCIYAGKWRGGGRGREGMVHDSTSESFKLAFAPII